MHRVQVKALRNLIQQLCYLLKWLFIRPLAIRPRRDRRQLFARPSII